MRYHVVSIVGNCLTCRLYEQLVTGCVPPEFTRPSRVQALRCLWHPQAHAAPLGVECSEREIHNEVWPRENADRFVSCVGVRDFGEFGSGVVYGPEETLYGVVYEISVTSPQWLEGLAPDAEWNAWHGYCDDKKVKMEASWRTTDVMLIAKRIRDSQEFVGLPVLADALQEAGCDCDDLLNHLRTPLPHVRGCWALDLVVGLS